MLAGAGYQVQWFRQSHWLCWEPWGLTLANALWVMFAAVTFQMLFRTRGTHCDLCSLRNSLMRRQLYQGDLSSHKNTKKLKNELCSKSLILGPKLHQNMNLQECICSCHCTAGYRPTVISGGKSRSPRVSEGFEPRTAAPPRRGAWGNGDQPGLTSRFFMFFSPEFSNKPNFAPKRYRLNSKMFELDGTIPSNGR